MINNPLDLPEIRHLVGADLNKSALAACCLVSRAWKESFAPLLWSDIRWKDIGKNDDERLWSLKPNTRHVKSLGIIDDIPPHLALLNFPRLETISNANYLNSSDQEPASTQAMSQSLIMERLVLQSPCLQFLSLYTPAFAISEGFCGALQSRDDFYQLDACSTKVDIAATDDFWKVCYKLKSLSLLGQGVLRIPSKLPRQAFRNLTCMKMSWLKGISPQQQLALLAECPILEILLWFMVDGGSDEDQGYHIAEFVNLTGKRVWPRLSTLQMYDSQLTDPELAVLLGSMNKITRFDLGRTGFGPLAFPVLEQHFESVTYLDMATSPGFTSAMVQRVLELFPSLELIWALILHGDDILHGQPWVCKALKEWRIHLDIDPLGDQHGIFEQLGTLTNLETFEFGQREDWIMEGKRFSGTLRLRLEDGLKALQGLKKLSCLRMAHTEQRMSVRDAAFIILTWEGMDITYAPPVGAFHPDEKQHATLVDMFRLAGYVVVSRDCL